MRTSSVIVLVLGAKYIQAYLKYIVCMFKPPVEIIIIPNNLNNEQ